MVVYMVYKKKGYRLVSKKLAKPEKKGDLFAEGPFKTKEEAKKRYAMMRDAPFLSEQEDIAISRMEK